MNIPFSIIFYSIYIFIASFLLIYGLNCYVMVFLFKRKKTNAKLNRKDILKKYQNFDIDFLPKVTTQIAVFNEYNVIERISIAACNIDYPKNKHEIQILDDSNDETKNLIDTLINRLQKQGHNIKVIRRKNRIGFKAGALANGLELSKGNFIAVFDADFIPPKDFLKKSIPFFLENDNLGLVQARWGHINSGKSLLTHAQAIGIDGHFMIEQSARDWNNLFMNFNGTAGIWRKKAIIDSGGWQWDTLTEDMDLSYRMQLNKWDTFYNPDLVVPAEIPEDVNAFKSQQFRWAKGSIQTAIKLLPQIFRSKDISLFKKVEAVFHMTHYMVHLFMVLVAVLALPVLIFTKFNLGQIYFTIFGVILILAIMAPNYLYIISQKYAYKKWLKKLLYLPFLVIIGVGIAVSNSKAVLEALFGIKTDFIRTPKKGDSEIKKYKVKKSKILMLELFEVFLGCYCLFSFIFYLSQNKYLIGPFLGIYALGFLYIGILSLYTKKYG